MRRLFLKKKDSGAVRIRVNGGSISRFELPDDPADHRGILSWHAQKQEGTLSEAGSYGFWCRRKSPAAS